MPLHQFKIHYHSRTSFIVGIATTITLVMLFSSCTMWNSGDRNRKPSFVSTVAGANGEFGEPFGVTILNGAVYVSDGEKDCIWRLDHPAGPVAVAGGLDTPSGIAAGPDGDLFVADTGSHSIRSIDAAGVATVVAGVPGTKGGNEGNAGSATFHGPTGIAVGPDGTIYVADTYNDRIRKIVQGTVSTLAGSSRGFTDGSGADARFDTPTGLAMFGENLIVADTGNGRLRVVEPDGRTWTLAGAGIGDLKDGSLSAAGLYHPTSISIDRSGNIYFTDGNAVRSITSGPLPTIRTLSEGRRGFSDDELRISRFNRPSGLAVDPDGNVWISDSENGLVRKIASERSDGGVSSEQLSILKGDPASFRNAGQPRWPYDPPAAVRDIAGTLGEIRGKVDDSIDPVWFHNGLDIAGAYGETARFIRDEKVLRPIAAENFGTLRELLRMPTLGYIHIRLGRDVNSRPFDDARFVFDRDATGKLTDIRVPRGAKFAAGEPIGTLNAMNHVHLIAGPSGYEMNGLDALALPGLTDTRPPVIEKVTLFDENWREVETTGDKMRITLSGNTRAVVRAYDQTDGNSERRRLGLFRLGYNILSNSTTEPGPVKWTISFDRLPPSEFVRMVYGKGSHSGATGVTVFNYIITNTVNGDGGSEGFIDTASLDNGIYVLRVYASDYFGNTSTKDITFEVNK